MDIIKNSTKQNPEKRREAMLKSKIGKRYLNSSNMSSIMKSCIAIILFAVVILMGGGRFLVEAIVKWLNIIPLLTNDLLMRIISDIITKYFIFLVLVLLFFPELKQGIKKVQKRKRLIFVLPLFYILQIVIIFLLSYILLALYGEYEVVSNNQNMLNSAIKLSPVIMSISTILLGPVIEELVFREAFNHIIGFGFSKLTNRIKINPNILKRISIIITTIISSVSFGLIHVIVAGDYMAIAPYIAMGLVMNIIYYLFDENIIYSILYHMFINALGVILMIF